MIVLLPWKEGEKNQFRWQMDNSQRMMDYSSRHPPSFGWQSVFQCETVKTTAKELKDSLNIVYEDKSLVNNIFLRWQLYNLKMNDEESVYDHLNEFNALLTSLLGIGVKIDEEEQTTIFLWSILDSCDNLIMSSSHVTKLHMNL